MNDFILKDVNGDLEQELEQIGFDETYLHKAVDKFQYKNIKIFDLTVPQANILKQTAISVGADCAVHRETITSKVEKTDCLLGGSFSQLKKISQKLHKQPFNLSKLADLIEKNLDFKLLPIKIKETTFDFTKPYIVGVLNLTQNSFSDGGEFFEFDKAKKHLLEMIKDGADIIELGAESTKPFSSPVSANDQLKKLLPILKFIEKEKIKTPISIDTRSAEVAEKCIKSGADMINDVSGFEYDNNMIATIAELDVPVIIQHSQGTPENMQIRPTYGSLMDEIFLGLNNKINIAIAGGIKQKNIIIDAGIGFGKTKEQNFEIIKRIDELFSLNCPVMLGVSRKSLLGMPDVSNDVKDIFTLALNAVIIDKKVNFIRVHNVKLHKNLLQIQ
ncbi:MAG: dihydropteroate synthase [Candidatus Gastranaerophilaceae bacterium]